MFFPKMLCFSWTLPDLPMPDLPSGGRAHKHWHRGKRRKRPVHSTFTDGTGPRILYFKSSKNTLYIKERSSLKRTSLQLTQPQIHYAHIFTLIWNTSFAFNHNHIYSVNHSVEWLIGTNWSFYISKLYKTLKNSYGLGIAFLIFLIILYSHFV